MEKLKAAAAALILCFQPAGVSAAVPEFGTTEGELGCVGLMGIGLAGAGASQPPVPQVVGAMAMALGFYLGRLTKVDPKATKQDVDRVLTELTLEEKNTYVNVCIKKAAELMRPTLN
ncbi:MAG: hypothetical protein Q7T84_00660 [Phenylobacterium sp.]|uniref:hypothetical protein n=1 Tax=Phenylobacterium sp. TaxID=1871053 RepID=UPI0027161472|nr:hypothetical protein [Phenylobacterium sp.]MDO9429788.1 hypothetical protein [Phenylobacterium sp.]